jgi:hypothetical protein
LVIKHEGDKLWLNAPLFYATVGQTLEVWPGCDKTLAACRDKFNNAPRFGGFPHIPDKNPVLTALKAPSNQGGKK